MHSDCTALRCAIQRSSEGLKAETGVNNQDRFRKRQPRFNREVSTAATSEPGLGSRLPHLRRDCAQWLLHRHGAQYIAPLPTSRRRCETILVAPLPLHAHTQWHLQRATRVRHECHFTTCNIAAALASHAVSPQAMLLEYDKAAADALSRWRDAVYDPKYPPRPRPVPVLPAPAPPRAFVPADFVRLASLPCRSSHGCNPNAPGARAFHARERVCALCPTWSAELLHPLTATGCRRWPRRRSSATAARSWLSATAAST
jgi:hypothetical protein